MDAVFIHFENVMNQIQAMIPKISGCHVEKEVEETQIALYPQVLYMNKANLAVNYDLLDLRVYDWGLLSPELRAVLETYSNERKIKALFWTNVFSCPNHRNSPMLVISRDRLWDGYLKCNHSSKNNEECDLDMEVIKTVAPTLKMKRVDYQEIFQPPLPLMMDIRLDDIQKTKEYILNKKTD